MASKRIAIIQRLHEAFNQRDLDAALAGFASVCTITDHATGETMKTPDEYRDWLQGWLTAFPDGRISVPDAFEAGDRVVVQSKGTGTNTGPLGTLPATGKTAHMEMCDVYRFDADDRIVSLDSYYDQLSILAQLGHAEPPM